MKPTRTQLEVLRLMAQGNDITQRGWPTWVWQCAGRTVHSNTRDALLVGRWTLVRRKRNVWASIYYVISAKGRKAAEANKEATDGSQD